MLFEVHRLCFAVVSQAQCSVIELRGTLVCGVGNTVLSPGSNTCFTVFLCKGSGCCPHGLSLVSRV